MEKRRNQMTALNLPFHQILLNRINVSVHTGFEVTFVADELLPSCSFLSSDAENFTA